MRARIERRAAQSLKEKSASLREYAHAYGTRRLDRAAPFVAVEGGGEIGHAAKQRR